MASFGSALNTYNAASSSIAREMLFMSIRRFLPKDNDNYIGGSYGEHQPVLKIIMRMMLNHHKRMLNGGFAMAVLEFE